MASGGSGDANASAIYSYVNTLIGYIPGDSYTIEWAPYQWNGYQTGQFKSAFNANDRIRFIPDGKW